MKKKANQIDLVKMLFFILKHLWLLVLCAELGFGAFYMYMTRRMPETYTATGTMYVSSYNPEYIDDNTAEQENEDEPPRQNIFG